MKHVRSVAIGSACLVAALSACGSSSGTKGQGSGAQSSTTPSTAGAAAGPYGGFTLSKPLVLGELWEVQGESSAAINDFQDGAKLAIDQINAAGGVGGKPVSAVRKPFSPSDAQSARSAFLDVAGQHPSFLIGAIGGTLESLTRDVDGAGIPVLGNLSDNKVLFGSSSGSKWIFTVPASYLDLGPGAAQFAAQELKATKVGLFNTSDPSNTAAIGATKDALGQQKVSIAGSQTVDPTATDVTSSVLALKGDGLLVAAAYPQPLALALKARTQNAPSLPVLSVGVSGPIIVSSKAVTADQIKNFYTSVQCNPASKNSPAVTKFVDAYESEFKAVPTAQAAVQYDSVFIAAEAAKLAGSTSPDALRDALLKVQYKGGVCSDDYHADGAQLMSHNASIIKWESNQEVVKTYSFPDHDKQ